MTGTGIELAQPLISAAAGLIGVFVGGWLQACNQKLQRRHDRIREQLERFYSPLLAARARILAKGQVGSKALNAVDAAWRALVTARTKDVEALEKLSEKRLPDFRKVIEENNRQFMEETMPLYRQMTECFASNMWLAEPSTRAYFGALVAFVELWTRWLNGTLPREALEHLQVSDEQLQPFYQDLLQQSDGLRRELASM